MGIWVDFDSDLWLYIPMALPEGYSSPKKWAWDKSVAIAGSLGLSSETTMSLCKHIESLAESSNEFEHRFVLLKELDSQILNVTIMFDANNGEHEDISELLTNEESDESLLPFKSENLGSGLKALTLRTKKRIFRDDELAYQFRYAFMPPSLLVTAYATHPQRDFLLRHENSIDNLVRSVIAVV